MTLSIKAIKIMKLALLMSVTILFLSACSGHPTAGNWSIKSDSTAAISRIEIKFEGRAVLSKHGDIKDDYHCFWNARSATMITLKCRRPGEEAVEQYFELAVSDNENAILTDKNQVVGSYIKQSS